MNKKALLIIDHGSRRKSANHMLFDLVKFMREQCPDLLIFGAHMELARPTIDEGIQWCIKKGATHIIAHPYMLSPGRHATEDIPRMVNESMKAHPNIGFELTDPLGIDIDIVSLILKRAGLK